MSAWAKFNHEQTVRTRDVERILREYFIHNWDGAFYDAAKKIIIALGTKAPPPPTPPAEFQFAEAFQSLTMRCLGYDAEIKALMRDVRALQDRMSEHEEFPELEPK